MMTQFEHLSRSNQTSPNKTQHQTLQKGKIKVAEGLRSVYLDPLKELIKDQVKSVATPSNTYSNPYTKRIDHLKMLENYQLSKFKQLDGQENLRQHVA
ncbi:hypothetical protein J1N35_024697 [Gossypium stocksii]|uniref:Uncharacterized protein n=1 Tax=Gossypium stocksii TaxID=47602 RepID=A0A9D3V516_9ROSI|nr:hypothetical protein J1N35_024697 [Gossypium stocksii]